MVRSNEKQLTPDSKQPVPDEEEPFSSEKRLSRGGRQILESAIAAFNREDAEAVAGTCAIEGRHCVTSVDLLLRGRHSVERSLGKLFELVQNLRFEPDGLIASEGATATRSVAAVHDTPAAEDASRVDVASAWGRLLGTIGGDALGAEAVGRQVEVPISIACSLSEGLIESSTCHLDVAALYRQAGLPVPPLEIYPRAARFVSGFSGRWSKPEPESFRDLLHPDTVNLYPGMTEPQGRDGVLAWIGAAVQMFPGLSIRVTRWAVDESAVMIEMDASATVGGRQMRWQAVDRFTLAGDRCIEGRSYFDTMPLMEALRESVPGET